MHSASPFGQVFESWSDPSPHRVQFVTVAKNVRLEVLDWGGSGRPVVLLSGLGHTAHVFDDFATRLTALEGPGAAYHVYGMTRRGYGASSVPVSGYSAAHLADDVIAVLDSLKLAHPVLVGHSIAGEELSSLGARHPDRIAGLVYLDAAYDRTDRTLRTAVAKMAPEPTPAADDYSSVQTLRAWMARAAGVTVPEAEVRNSVDTTPDGKVRFRTPPWVPQAIIAGVQTPDYTKIRAPALAIYAVPRSASDLSGYKDDDASRAVFDEVYSLVVRRQTAAMELFRSRVAKGRVIALPGAHHYVFLSNEADVLRELHAFVVSLP